MKVFFHGNTNPTAVTTSITAKSKAVMTDNGTAAIASIEDLQQSLGVQMDEIKSVGFYLNKVRDGLVMSGAKASSSSMTEVEKALAALNTHIKGLEIRLKVTPMEERMLALEKIVKKSLEEPAHKTASCAVPRSGGRPTYASIVAPPATKAAVRIRMEGSEKMQPAELLKKAELHITGAYAVRQLKNSDTEVFVGSVSQRDTILGLAQPKEFKILKPDYPVEIVGVPLGTNIEKGKTANNGRIISEITEATKLRIPGIKINRVK